MTLSYEEAFAAGLRIERPKYDYTIRTVSVPEDGHHECGGRIVSVIAATQNPATRNWYLTALVERDHKEK